MKKLKLQVQMTIDGYISGINGEMDWMIWNWDEELKKYVTELTEPVDCILLGRKLAQGFIPHWASNPEEEGAYKINSTKKVVFSKTLEKSEWDNTIVVNGDFIEAINNLKKEVGKDLIVYGGGTFVASLIKAGLIDEFHLFVNPVILGHGMTIFNEVDKRQALKLVKSKAFECGIVVLNYELNKN